jgi:hypothetical protein
LKYLISKPPETRTIICIFSMNAKKNTANHPE